MGEYGKQKKWWMHFLDENKARPMEIKRNGGFAFGWKKEQSMEAKRNGGFAFWMKKYQPWKQKRLWIRCWMKERMRNITLDGCHRCTLYRSELCRPVPWWQGYKKPDQVPPGIVPGFIFDTLGYPKDRVPGSDIYVRLSINEIPYS